MATYRTRTIFNTDTNLDSCSMGDVSVLTSNLLMALESVKSAIEPSPQLAILSNVAIIAENSYMSFFATNLQTFASFKIGAKVDRPFSITLPFRQLYELVKLAYEGRVDFILDHKTNNVAIYQDTWLAHIKGMSIEEFPPMASGESQSIGLFKYAELKRIVEMASRYLSSNDNRPGLYQIHIMTGETWQFWASDAKNYFSASLKNESEDKTVKSIAIGGKALEKLIKSFAKSKAEEIEFSIMKDRELIKIGEFGRDNPQVIQYEPGKMEIPAFKRMNSAKLYDIDLLQKRILKNRGKKANQSDSLSFGYIAKYQDSFNPEYDGAGLSCQLRVRDNEQENIFSLSLPMNGTIGPNLKLVGDAPTLLANSLGEICKFAETAYLDRVFAGEYGALQFRVESGNMSMILGYSCNEAGEKLSAKLSESKSHDNMADKPEYTGKLESLHYDDNSLILAGDENGRVYGVEFVKSGSTEYTRIQFQVINGRKAYGQVLGKITGKLQDEMRAIEKAQCKKALDLPAINTDFNWAIITGKARYIATSIKERDKRTGALIVRRIRNFLKPDGKSFLGTDNKEEYPINWDEISLENSSEAENIETQPETAPEAQYIAPAVPAIEEIASEAQHIEGQPESTPEAQNIMLKPEDLPQGIQWLIKNSRVLQDELGHDMPDSGAFNNSIPFKMGQELLAWLDKQGIRKDINNLPWGQFSGQYAYGFEDEYRNFEIILTPFSYGGKRFSVRMAFHPKANRPARWDKTFKQAPEAQNIESQQESTPNAPAIPAIEEISSEAQNIEAMSAVIANSKIIAPPAAFFSQNIDMNELINNGETQAEAQNSETPELYPMPVYERQNLPKLAAIAPGRWYCADIWRMGSGHGLSLVYVRKIEGNSVFFHDTGEYDKFKAEKTRTLGEFDRYINDGYKKLPAFWQQIPETVHPYPWRELISVGVLYKQVAYWSPSPRKYALKAITFEWSESGAYEFPLTVDSWQAANEIVKGIAAEHRGAYAKTDILVEWSDGYTYKMRYDIGETGDSQDVAGRIWDYCAFVCGLRWELHFSPGMLAMHASEIEERREFLQNYDLNGWQDRPSYVEVEAPAIPRPEDKEPEPIPASPYADRRRATAEERHALTATRYDHKQTANFIRDELKKAFPSIKFSVRAESSTWSYALSVRWMDGPTVGEIEHILGKYASEESDGWDGSDFVYWMLGSELVNYGIRFMSANRSYSSEFLRTLAEAANAETGNMASYTIEEDKESKAAHVRCSGEFKEVWEGPLGRPETFGYFVMQRARGISALSPAPSIQASEAPAIQTPATAPDGKKPIKVKRLASVWELSGDTKPHREAIKRAGGRWDALRALWLISGDFPETLKALSEFEELPALESLSKGNLHAAGYANHWRIYGETFPVKNTLKAAGFNWNGFEWILNKAELPQTVRDLFAPDSGGNEPNNSKKQAEAENIEASANSWGSWGNPKPSAAKAEPEPAEAQNIGDGAKIAQRLRQAADALEPQIAEKFRERNTNTYKRAQHDEQARKDGQSLQKRQNMLRALADMHELGTIAPLLAAIRSRKDLDLILQRKPSRRIYMHVIHDLYKATKEGKAGLNQEESNLLGIIRGRCYSNGNEYGWIYQGELKTLRSLEKKALKVDKYLATSEDLERFERLGITEENHAQALAELLQLADPDGTIKASATLQPLRNKQNEAARGNIPGYVPTPPDVVALMLEWAEHCIDAASILEPSAGAGHIAEALRKSFPKAKIECIEWSLSLSEILKEKGFKLLGDDFLAYQGEHDLIVMNPPFEDGQDIEHVLHAWDCLKAGGRIVAIMSDGVFSRKDNQAQGFQSWLKVVDGYSEKLPDGSFLKSDVPVNVRTRLVVLDKPSFSPEEEKTEETPVYKEETAPEGENFEAEAEEESGDYRALISWEEGKLELHSRWSLDKEEFKALMGQGFKYVRGETIYYAPYTPWRHKYLIENFGISQLEDDFEKHLRDRAEGRSERFEGFSDNAAKRGAAHHETANRISERFYMGQPILVGHHSEKKARSDQARMWANEDKWVQETDRASYWSSRADGALRRAVKRESLRAVVNRIDRLEADLRKAERELAKSPGGKSWHWESWIWFYTNRLDYERALLAAMPDEKKPDTELKIEKGGLVRSRGTWNLIEGIGSKNVVIHPFNCTIKIKLATITPANYKSPAEYAELLAAKHVKIVHGGLEIIEEDNNGA